MPIPSGTNPVSVPLLLETQFDEIEMCKADVVIVAVALDEASRYICGCLPSAALPIRGGIFFSFAA